MGKLSTASIVGLSLAPFTGGLSLAATAPDVFKAMQPHVPDVKPPKEADDEAALARERERKRLASSGSRADILSGRKADALSASIGKRMLGGAS